MVPYETYNEVLSHYKAQWPVEYQRKIEKERYQEQKHNMRTTCVFPITKINRNRTRGITGANLLPLHINLLLLSSKISLCLHFGHVAKAVTFVTSVVISLSFIHFNVSPGTGHCCSCCIHDIEFWLR